MPRRLQSILALLAGLVLVAVLALGTHLVVGIHTLNDGTGLPMGPVVPVIGVGYAFLFCMFGSYATACFAPRRPLRHAVELGVLALGLMLVLTFKFWRETPTWYHFATLAVVLPAAWLGGTLRERQIPSA